jgi:hypothetical protein
VQTGDRFTVQYVVDTSLLTSTFPTPADPPTSQNAITFVSLTSEPLVSPGVFGPSELEFDSAVFSANPNSNEVRVSSRLLSFSASVPTGTKPFNTEYFYNRVRVQLGPPLMLDPNTTDLAATIVAGINGGNFTPSVEVVTTHIDTDTNATFLLNNLTLSSIVAVPEPSSFAALGCICTAAALRRKRRTRSMN